MANNINLPEGYQRIEYLQSTGTQWIGTGLVHTTGYRYLIDIAVVTNDSGYRSIIGAATGGDNDKFYLSTTTGSPYSMYLNNKAITPVDIDIYSRLQLSLVQSNTTTILYHNEDILGSASCTIFGLPVMLMARNSSNQKMIGRYYAFKAWDGNNTLLKDFIPVRVGQVGYMYDTVSGELFGNAGSGEFILGPDIDSSFGEGFLNFTGLKRLISWIKSALNSKQDVLTFDSAPTASSTNPVTSGGIATALNNKQNTLVSGTNIKTINNESLLGSGNVSVNGVENVSAPSTADGTWQITLTNGDTITIDLNHVHPQYLKYELVQSLPASPDSDTLYLIAVS